MTAAAEPPLSFSYRSSPVRVVFGDGALASLADELDTLGLRRALVLSTPNHRELAERVAAQLGERAVGVHAGAVMHVPVETADAAPAVAAELGSDSCVAVGGGSTVGGSPPGRCPARRGRWPQRSAMPHRRCR